MSGKVRFVDSNITISPGAGGTSHAAISASYALSASYADYAVSASHEIVKEVSSSYADTASYAITASYALNGGAGGGSGIFAETGSYYATTNNLQVTGSLKTTKPITTSGYVSIAHNGAEVSGGTAALFLGTTNQGMDLVRLNDNTLVLGGVTQNYGWRIFGIKHGLNSSIYTTEIDNLIATGSIKVSGSMDIALQSGSAFTIRENDLTSNNDDRLVFGYSNGDPALRIISDGTGVATIRLQDEETSPTSGLTLNQTGQFRLGDDNGFKMTNDSATEFDLSPIVGSPSSNTNDLGNDTRPWSNLYVYNGMGYSSGAGAGSFNSKRVNISGENRNTGIFNYGQMSLQYSGSVTDTLDNPLNHFFGIRLSNDYTPTSIKERLIFSVGKSGSLGININQGKTGMTNPNGATYTFYTASAMVHVEAEPNYGLNLFQGNNVLGNRVFYIDGTGEISASGDLYARDGRFSRDGIAEIEVISSDTDGGIVGTHTNDNLVLRRFNIPKLTISESRTFSHQKLDVQGQVSASSNLFARQLYVEDQLAVDYSDGIAIGNATDPIRLINDVTASGAISASGDIIGNSLSTNEYVYFQGSGSNTYFRGGVGNVDLYLNGAQKIMISSNLAFNNFANIQFTNTDINITGNNKMISGSATSTASFGTYLGDGSQLENLPTQDPFPYIGDAIITGSLDVNGSDMRIGIFSTPGFGDSFNISSTTQDIFISAKVNGTASLNSTFGIAKIDSAAGRVQLGELANTIELFTTTTISGDTTISGSLTLSGSLLNTGTVSVNNGNGSPASPYTLTGTQQFILIDPSGGDVTINMPDAATYPGREIKFKLTQAAGANTVTLQRQGADTIDGATTYTDLDIQYESISTVSDGSTGWFIF